MCMYVYKHMHVCMYMYVYMCVSTCDVHVNLGTQEMLTTAMKLTEACCEVLMKPKCTNYVVYELYTSEQLLCLQGLSGL